MKFGYLIFRKIIKFVATKFNFACGSDLAGELTALPRPPSWILGA